MSLPIKLQIPKDFLKEENLCEYAVTSKDKKIWAIELDLLNEFKNVCEKYNLKWFIAYGSLIGSIRHKGFIPWDNDVDVWMPRKDFRKLCEIASEEFQYPYFLSYAVSEHGNRFSTYAKLCNSLTTGGGEDMWLQGVNCGLFIDIFILDEIPDDDKAARKMVEKVNYYSHFARFLSPYPRHDKGLKLLKHLYWKILWELRYKCCKGDKLYLMIDELLGSTEGKNYQRLYYVENDYNSNLTFPKELFSEVVWMPFEMITVAVPVGYEQILKQLYGDYMSFPPIEDRVTHEYLDLEPEIPYKEYYRKK